MPASLAGPCPFGAGWHPYLFAFGALVDDAAVTVKAETTYLVDDRGLPTGTRPVDGTDVDFRAGRRIGAGGHHLCRLCAGRRARRSPTED